MNRMFERMSTYSILRISAAFAASAILVFVLGMALQGVGGSPVSVAADTPSEQLPCRVAVGSVCHGLHNLDAGS